MFTRRKDRRGGGDSPHEVFLRLRGQLLEVDPAELGFSPSPRLPRIWATLMEMGLDTGTASLVAVADGTTSLYLSTGGGVIGGGEHQAVRRVSEAFLDTAEAHLDRLQPISKAPLPQTGAHSVPCAHIRFTTKRRGRGRPTRRRPKRTGAAVLRRQRGPYPAPAHRPTAAVTATRAHEHEQTHRPASGTRHPPGRRPLPRPG